MWMILEGNEFDANRPMNLLVAYIDQCILEGENSRHIHESVSVGKKIRLDLILFYFSFYTANWTPFTSRWTLGYFLLLIPLQAFQFKQTLLSVP